MWRIFYRGPDFSVLNVPCASAGCGTGAPGAGWPPCRGPRALLSRPRAASPSFLTPSGTCFVTHSFNKYLRARCVRGCRAWAKDRAPCTVCFPSVGSRDQIPFPCISRPPRPSWCALTWPCVLTEQGHPVRGPLAGLLPCCRLQSRPSARVESSFVP